MRFRPGDVAATRPPLRRESDRRDALSLAVRPGSRPRRIGPIRRSSLRSRATPSGSAPRTANFEWSIYGAEFEQFVEFLRSKNSAEHNEPDYSISSISITGSCDDERAQLTAKFEIQVERDGVWLAVPIGMQEGSLVPSMRQTGAGEFRAVPSSIG